MRGTKAKRLRRAASKHVTTHRIRETTELALGGGVSRYLSGVRRVYQDSKQRTA
jgi:hypothetical protein